MFLRGLPLLRIRSLFRLKLSPSLRHNSYSKPYNKTNAMHEPDLERIGFTEMQHAETSKF